MLRNPSHQIKTPKNTFGLLRSIKALLSRSSRRAFFADVEDAPPSYAEYIDWVLERFNVSYYSSQRSRLNVPANGRVIVFANHPISSLDGLALLRFLNEIRPDVRLISMDLLTDCAQLGDRVIPVSRGSMRERRQSIRGILEALKQEQAVVVFPAVKLSALRKSQPRDGKWSHRFLKLALYSNAPLLPVFLESKITKRPAFARRSDKIMSINNRHDLFINAGEAISIQEIRASGINVRKRCKQLKRHLYRVGKGRPGVFMTQKTIVHPQPPAALRSELANASLLGETLDGHQIYLYDSEQDSVLLREIGRLREYTFRAVGEGTGQHIDLDRYDYYYRHLVLWNDRQLEVVGAYRLAEAGDVLNRFGLDGLYCHELFELSNEFLELMSESIELGRSFVQPKYWGKRSLEYLWYGLGAYLRLNPAVRYLYGPVSISNAYPDLAKQALVRFYQHYFGRSEPLVTARRAYLLTGENTDPVFSGDNYQDDFTRLKEYLDYFDVKVPTLYKQYTELCEPGGAVIDAFSVDPNFGYCVDGLVRLDLTMVKAKKLQRYVGA